MSEHCKGCHRSGPYTQIDDHKDDVGGVFYHPCPGLDQAAEIARLTASNATLTARYAEETRRRCEAEDAAEKARQFSDENIERLTKLHGEALTECERLKEAILVGAAEIGSRDAQIQQLEDLASFLRGTLSHQAAETERLQGEVDRLAGPCLPECVAPNVHALTCPKALLSRSMKAQEQNLSLRATLATQAARIAALEGALRHIRVNRIDDVGPCDGDPTECPCSQHLADRALATPTTPAPVERVVDCPNAGLLLAHGCAPCGRSLAALDGEEKRDA